VYDEQVIFYSTPYLLAHLLSYLFLSLSLPLIFVWKCAFQADSFSVASQYLHE